MRIVVAAAVLVLALPAVAFDLGNQAPAKPQATHQTPPADPDVIRQGGDTILDAIFLPVPAVNVTGTTAGYSDDYDEVCPYDGSTSPDVVYRLAPQSDVLVDISMYGSTYDTKIYVYDASYALVACNDDFYSDYTSKLESVPLAGNTKYYLVIDGYGGDAGDYLLNVNEYEPCEVECPNWAELEGEPPLANDYVDNWNGGCNTDPVNGPFGSIYTPAFCGVSGFYLSNGGNFRDTDWFTIEIPYIGVLEIIGDAELATYMFELGPQDCNSVGVIQNVIVGPCSEGVMTITGTPGSTIWFWVGPTTFAAPDGLDVYEYDYLLWLNFYNPELPVATETQSWTSVKSLFR